VTLLLGVSHPAPGTPSSVAARLVKGLCPPQGNPVTQKMVQRTTERQCCLECFRKKGRFLI